MKLINIGVAGCLGRMGKELVKKSISDPRVNFVGGFEHKKHELINKNLSEILNCDTNQIVNANPEEVFNISDVLDNKLFNKLISIFELTLGYITPTSISSFFSYNSDFLFV